MLADPASGVLLDRSAAENAIEIVVAFSTAEDETVAVKSDLIKAVDKYAFDTALGGAPRDEESSRAKERVFLVPQWPSPRRRRRTPGQGRLSYWCRAALQPKACPAARGNL
jgi:hypothetical protein